MTPRRLASTLLALLALLLAAASPAAAQTPMGTNGAAVPELDWAPCPIEEPEPEPENGEEGEEPEAPLAYECATAEVPLSYRDPDGQTIELAVAKLPAADPERRIGTLFWNPGGPGGSGRFFPPISEELHERFDLVGFDPRGVADSTPLRCFRDNDQALRLLGNLFPITPREERRYLRRTAAATRRCARRGGPILAHMSTANVARDLDLLRAAVGDDQLSYLGYSYGTQLGQVYANLFPDRVRALTLDAVLDPVAWTTGRLPGDRLLPVTSRLGSPRGANQALGSFLAACAADAERCAFAEEGVDLRAKYDALLTRLRAQPVVITTEEGEEVRVTYQDVVELTRGLLYFAPASPLLAEILEGLTLAAAPVTPGRMRPRVELPALPERRPILGRAFEEDDEEEPYYGLEWFSAVTCTDSVNPDDPQAWPAVARALDAETGPFGSPWTYYSLTCATWPAEDRDRYLGPWNRPTANPILLVGNSLGDPATPYEGAQASAGELADARLLTLDSFGHTAFGGLSTCIDEAVERYFIEGELPEEGTVCQPDRTPFEPLGDEEPEPLEARGVIPTTATD